jgi:hypothetical protein
MKMCYYKRFGYIVPTIKCEFCNTIIHPGEEVHSVTITWGDGKTACRDCSEEYEIDWILHDKG